MTTIIDTNVLIYLSDNAAPQRRWAVDRLVVQKNNGPILVPDIVYCECSVAFVDKCLVDAIILEFALDRIHAHDDALFRAGKAFHAYKKNRKENDQNFDDMKLCGVLPDFLIGAIAETQHLPILTNDVSKYRTYFPTVQLISP